MRPDLHGLPRPQRLSGLLPGSQAAKVPAHSKIPALAYK